MIYIKTDDDLLIALRIVMAGTQPGTEYGPKLAEFVADMDADINYPLELEVLDYASERGQFDVYTPRRN